MKSASKIDPQTVWEKTSRKHIKHRVEDEWKEEQKYRKEWRKPLILGYRIKVGKKCPHVKGWDGLVVLIEDVYDEPDLLPPYEGCKYDTCDCTYVRLMSDEGGKARFILEFADDELNARLTTRRKSPVGFERSSCGRSVTETRDITW